MNEIENSLELELNDNRPCETANGFSFFKNFEGLKTTPTSFVVCRNLNLFFNQILGNQRENLTIISSYVSLDRHGYIFFVIRTCLDVQQAEK
jgi:hypothetical protein